MSTKFTEYKGLDLPTVASEVLILKKENIFEQSVTTREGNPPCVLKVHFGKWITGNLM
jgi:isoleucyl-tRNA synthetase